MFVLACVLTGYNDTLLALTPFSLRSPLKLLFKRKIILLCLNALSRLVLERMCFCLV